MDGTLLQAKRQIPPVRRLVPRPRLATLLERAWAYPLTLIVAPPGAGKTSLASGWAAGQGGARAVAWLTLDAADAEPGRFAGYLLAALRGAAPAVAAALDAAGPAPAGGAIEQLPDLLLNALAPLRQELALVIEDYHLVDGEAVRQALARLIDYLPPHVHLVITARREPRLPLARWRARGMLHEIGLDELRFTEEEAGRMIEEVAGRGLPADAIAALTARAEGWAVALQLAALALREQPDPAAFVAAFGGGQRYLAAYLREEVLAQQPPAARALLLQAAILDQLCPELCDAVLGGPPAPPSAPLLAELARDSLLLTPLGAESRWYRLHPLLREFLDREGEGVDRGELHRRAAAWFAEHGPLEAAVRHGLAGGAPELAARALAAEVPAMMSRHELPALKELLALLPQGAVRAHPRLCCAQIWLLLDASRPAAAAAYLEQLAADPPAELGAELLALHAVHAAMSGKLDMALALAREAERQHSAADPLTRALIAFGLGAAYKLGDQGGRAEHCLRESASAALAADNRYLASEAYGNLGDLLVDLGRLPEAAAALDQALALARGPSGAELPAAGWLRWDRGRIAYEWNDLATASHEAAAAIALCGRWGNAPMWTRSLLLAAQTAQARGDLAAALAHVDEVERVAHLAEDDRLRQMVARRRLAIAIARRQLEPARLMVELLEARVSRPASAAHELAVARWWLAVGQPNDARAHLARAHRRLDETSQAALRVQAYILEALALRALGQGAPALVALERALALAGPSRFVRSFLDEGAPLQELLRRAAGSSAHAPYIGALLAAFAPAEAAPLPLQEPPSERERQVLRLLAAGCSNREIADQLVIAESTAKRHVSNLYLKLGVQSRTQAVARAVELRLI
jgi:LuxR family maltose regulon positive regulatory protein